MDETKSQIRDIPAANDTDTGDCTADPPKVGVYCPVVRHVPQMGCVFCPYCGRHCHSH